MRIVATVARSLVIGFWLASAAYAFLISVPFVYEQFLLPGLVPALVAFARWQGTLALTAAPLTALALGKDYRQDQALDWGHLTRPEMIAAAASPWQRPCERATP